MSSGTVTLQAACLGARGTVTYTLQHRWLVDKLVQHVPVRGELMPYALPNVILACQGAAAEERPYEELIYERFRGPLIAESILAKLPPAPYRPEAHPMLDEEMVERIRAAVTAGPNEGSAPTEHPGPVAGVTRTVLARLGRL